jgi:hypothetical protein
MLVREEVGRVAERLEHNDWDGAQERLSLLMQYVATRPEARARAAEALVERIGDHDPRAGAMFALACGALVEQGADVAKLARAIAPPLERALVLAGRFARRAEQLPDEPELEDGIEVGGRLLSHTRLQTLADRDPEAAAGFLSLDDWYRPAVAAWTRDVEALAGAQGSATLRAAIDAAAACSGVSWLAMLMRVGLGAPCVVLLPEIGEGWSLRLSGVTDVGQLVTLLGWELREALARIGVDAQPTEQMLACMRGEGPQHLDHEHAFGAAIHLFPWQAFDPESGLPQDERFTWQAPGGRGDHSLPADFLPGDIVPLEGVRVFLLVGPRSPGARFVRVIPPIRSFSALRARLDDVRRLSPEEFRGWIQTVMAQCP